MNICTKHALFEPCDYRMLPIEFNIVKSKSKPEILNKRTLSKIMHDTLTTIKATWTVVSGLYTFVMQQLHHRNNIMANRPI